MVSLDVFLNAGQGLGTWRFQYEPMVGDIMEIDGVLYRVVSRRWLPKSGDLEIIVETMLTEVG